MDGKISYNPGPGVLVRYEFDEGTKQMLKELNNLLMLRDLPKVEDKEPIPPYSNPNLQPAQ